MLYINLVSIPYSKIVLIQRGKASAKPSNTRSSPQKKFVPPPIFNTDDYLHYPNTNSGQAEAHSIFPNSHGSSGKPEASKDSGLGVNVSLSEQSEDIPGTWPEIGET